jgi:hypothetical protein
MARSRCCMITGKTQWWSHPKKQPPRRPIQSTQKSASPQKATAAQANPVNPENNRCAGQSSQPRNQHHPENNRCAGPSYAQLPSEPLKSSAHPAPPFSAHPAPSFSVHPAPSFSVHPVPSFSAHPAPSLSVHPAPPLIDLCCKSWKSCASAKTSWYWRRSTVSARISTTIINTQSRVQTGSCEIWFECKRLTVRLLTYSVTHYWHTA